MRLNSILLIILAITTVAAHAQNGEHISLNIGDAAPQLKIREWIKGTPVPKFKKGMLYVLEYWATWCKPCRSAMPNLSATANKYRGKVTIIGIDLVDQELIPMKKIKAFVDNMGVRLDYHVATQDSNMAKAWINASGEAKAGIPKTFVINADGKLAWIGHPMYLDTVLPKIINNTWDVKEALARKNLNRRLESSTGKHRSI